MKKYLISTALSLFGLGAMLSGITVNAQTNVIQEVKVSGQDYFSELKNLIEQNFDYTNPELTEGSFTALVEFNLAKDGRLQDISASGTCPYVSGELKQVLSSLQYKTDVSKLGEMAVNTHYSMPVTVNISNGWR